MKTGRFKSFFLVFCMFVMLAPFQSSGASPSKSLYRINYGGDFSIADVASYPIDIAGISKPASVDAFLTAEQVAFLEQRGYWVELLIYDVNKYFDEVINYDGEMGAYHTYAEMLQELQTIQANHPDIAKLFNLGDSWETINKGADRHIWALKISDDVEVEDDTEPDLLFIGNYHAREIITPEVVLFLINYLIDNYGSDPMLTEFVNTREYWMVPMLNPDGHYFVEKTDPMWRKNRNRNGSTFVINYGVDLNRNHSYMWGYDNNGSSPFKFMEDYRGTGPASEPCTQAIENLAKSKHFVFSMSYHSYGDLFLFPWSYKDMDTPDHDLYIEISQEATKFNNYTYGNPRMGAIYNCNGEHDDYMYGEQTKKNKVIGMTTEIGESFSPPDAKIPELCEENRYAFLVLSKLADNPYEIFPFQVTAAVVNPNVQRGGKLEFSVSIKNKSTQAQTLDFWTAVGLGNKLVKNPSIGPNSITLSAGETKVYNYSENVPLAAPLKTFVYYTYIGYYPTNLRGMDSFEFTVLPK